MTISNYKFFRIELKVLENAIKQREQIRDSIPHNSFVTSKHCILSTVIPKILYLVTIYLLRNITEKLLKIICIQV